LYLRHDGRRVAAFLLGISVAWICGCGGPQEPPRANEIRAHLSAPPVSLSFIGKANDSNSEIFAVQVTDSLVQYDEKLILRPRLAESWEFSPDRLTLTLNLRRGVTWHDGEPFDADDVMYSVGMVREAALENRSFGPLFDAERVTVERVDDYTVRSVYTEATPEALEMWRLPIVPEHVAGRDARPGDGGAQRFLEGEFARHPIGCGPFRFVGQSTEDEILLEANDDYWDGRPRVDRLRFRVLPEQRTAYQALLAGDLDVMNLSSVLWHEALASAQGQRLEGFVYYRLSVWQISWNQDGSNPFFGDARVRRAMTLALDRRQFSESLQNGLARPGATAVHPDSPWADPEVQPLPYDPEQARRLLDEAGWIDRDGDGIRDKDGRPFRFRHLFPASSQQIVDQIAMWAQQSWEAVGLAVENEKLEWRAFQQRRNAHLFDAASFNLSFTPNPEDLYQLHHSSSHEGSWNFAGLRDAEVDRLLDQARGTFDVDARRALYAQLQRRLQELEPITCLFHFPTPVLHDRRLQGITPSPLDYWRTTRGPRTWYWSEAEAVSD